MYELPQITQIKEILQRYVLRVDNESNYSAIIQLPAGFRKNINTLIGKPVSYIKHAEKNVLLHEVTFINLQKVVLNPGLFLVIDQDGLSRPFDNSDLKAKIETEIGSERIVSSVYLLSYLNTLLNYQFILPDKTVDAIRAKIKEHFLRAIYKQKSEAVFEDSFFFDKRLYQCCNRLGAKHFDDLILKLHNSFQDEISGYTKIKFTTALTHFQSPKHSHNSFLQKSHKQAELEFRRTSGKSKRVIPEPRYKWLKGNEAMVVPLISLLIFVPLFLLLVFNSSTKEERKNTAPDPMFPDLTKLSFFQLFLFDQERVIENQYDSSKFSAFAPCEFKIDNSQFKNNHSDRDQFKEVVLFNSSQKDVIIISANENGLAYTFLKGNGNYAKLRPAEGMLKLYAGMNAESTISRTEDKAEIDFRFGTFTRQDSLLLLEEFNLNEIATNSRQFSLVEEKGTINIVPGVIDF